MSYEEACDADEGDESYEGGFFYEAPLEGCVALDEVAFVGSKVSCEGVHVDDDCGIVGEDGSFAFSPVADSDDGGSFFSEDGSFEGAETDDACVEDVWFAGCYVGEDGLAVCS